MDVADDLKTKSGLEVKTQKQKADFGSAWRFTPRRCWSLFGWDW
jgi:hypothetical protein